MQIEHPEAEMIGVPRCPAGLLLALSAVGMTAAEGLAAGLAVEGLAASLWGPDALDAPHALHAAGATTGPSQLMGQVVILRRWPLGALCILVRAASLQAPSSARGRVLPVASARPAAQCSRGRGHRSVRKPRLHPGGAERFATELVGQRRIREPTRGDGQRCQRHGAGQRRHGHLHRPCFGRVGDSAVSERHRQGRRQIRRDITPQDRVGRRLQRRIGLNGGLDCSFTHGGSSSRRNQEGGFKTRPYVSDYFAFCAVNSPIQKFLSM